MSQPQQSQPAGHMKSEVASAKDLKDSRDEKKVAPAPAKDDDDDWGAVPAFLRRSKIK
jgi:hypothetical protein